MGKLVVLKLNGSFERGFIVNLEIGEEERRAYAQILGELPSALELWACLQVWQEQYRRLGTKERIKPKEIIYGGAISSFEYLRQCAKELQMQFSSWLESKSFSAVNKRLREELNPNESIRVLLTSNDRQVYQLPWCQWDFVERYPRVEIAFSNPEFEQLSFNQLSKYNQKVKILAVLGNSKGIDLEKDRKLLAAIVDAEVVFLVEPQRQQLNSYLWDRAWDIVFFAGHSETRQDEGLIHLNAEDTLTIEDIKFAFKKAIAQGLKLAIFNSCDGMGLAYQLGQLSLPQIVVMREPVPDRIAQEFLKYFLQAFASGDSLYLSTRYARERLQGWEHQYPCASWLPAIYQHPAVNPLTWQALCTGTKTKVIPREYQNLWLLCLVITSLILFLRSLGGLQYWELRAFDTLISLRPSEPPDKRMLVITVDDRDIQYQRQEGMELEGSLADTALTQLLKKIESCKPKAIASDIIHDFPLAKELAKTISQSDRFFAICRIENQESNLIGIEPPPNLKREQVGFSNLPLDPDYTIRRHVLGMSPGQLCQSDQSLSLRLALFYLDNPTVQLTSKGLQIGELLLPQLKPNAGGYKLTAKEAQGYQILLNYRSSLPQQIPLREILQGTRDQELSKLVSDRIIFLGRIGHNQDLHNTPYSKNQPSRQWSGVFIHAQMTSQIISAVLDERPLLWWLPEWLEVIWIGSWSLVGLAIIVAWDLVKQRIVAIAIALIILFGCCWLFLLFGGWLPLIPPALTLVITGAIFTFEGLKK